MKLLTLFAFVVLLPCCAGDVPGSAQDAPAPDAGQLPDSHGGFSGASDTGTGSGSADGLSTGLDAGGLPRADVLADGAAVDDALAVDAAGDLDAAADTGVPADSSADAGGLPRADVLADGAAVDDSLAADAASGLDTATADADHEPDAAHVDAGTPADVTDSGSGGDAATPDACAAACDGKACGPDGCGGTCGVCGASETCDAGDCAPVCQHDCSAGAAVCAGASAGTCGQFDDDPCLEPGGFAPCDDGDPCTLDACAEPTGCVHAAYAPCAWPGAWTLSAQNPVLDATPSALAQGADNVYAPDVLRAFDQWFMWYGGQGKDGHDQIFLATSDDLVTWSKYPTWAAPAPVIPSGGANHVNDPSVVRKGGTFHMVYTEAPVGEEDRIHLATSQDGVHWQKHGMVLDVGPPGSWESDRVGRPSILYEEGEFRMWYDGQIYGVARHVGYATSPDGLTWTRHPANPIVLHEGAIDVDRVDGQYVMLAESGQGPRMYVGTDPTTFTYVGMLWGKSGQPFDAYGQVTPFLLAESGQALAILFGGAQDACWCKNRIAIAFPGADVPGCAGCLSGAASCQAACQAAGAPDGVCGAPGSTQPGACCACDPDPGCEGCLGAHPSCMAACQEAGKPGGFCASPGSTNPGACCACW